MTTEHAPANGTGFAQQAEASAAVWAALLAVRGGAAPAPDPGWSPAERAAWQLYLPLAGAGGRTPFWFGQVGQSLDGRVATVAGDATAVSGQQGLAHLHRCRALADAVIVGVCTALADDPRLTVRLVEGPNPARVIVDPRGRMPNDVAAFADDGARRLVVQACSTRRPRGVEVVALPACEGWIAPAAIRATLAARGLGRVLVEGGGRTLAGFLEAGLLERLHVAIAPLIIGSGPSGLRTAPIARLSDALRPETRVYGLETDVVFDCALAGGSASTSTWPTKTETAAEAVAVRA
ncbi:RibD family protein [Amaricoccus sp.]|uniref:RibD family protein n=1 Tax=Amaricoccus sp. TaxID=1872485 RepID=UPI001B71C993|nr:RibD family protein [Amaricoccus sp.]MBP7241179.1 RibD family protein [Amaricoccus sp.]